MFLITHLLRFSVRHPRLVLLLVGVITGCFIVFIPRIQLRLDGRSLIPSNLPQFAEGDQAASRFELRDLVLIGVGNEESGVYTSIFSCSILLKSQLEIFPAFAHIKIDTGRQKAATRID